MADLISRLRLESGEFDSKIKRAGQELMAYSEHCKETGLTMGDANKDAKDFAKALGSMQTTSSSARGKINELTEAFVNLKVMYKNMTDEEKNNTFGKNLAASLDQLKTRIDQAKTELNDVNKELGNTKQAEVDTKGGLEGLTSALGINIKTLAGWGTAIAAGKVALDVAKDAFFASESSVDEWGRTVAASQSLYEGFLTAINNGDISGYLSNIDSIVKAARLAYDELDKLGTMKTIQAPQISKQQTENERIRSMIQTGRYIAPQDGRRNAVFNGREMQNGDKLTAGQIRYLEKQLQGGMQKVVKLVGNEVDQTGKAINAYYDKLAKTNGMSLQEFKKGTSSWEEFSKKMQGYEQYKEWDKQARTEFAKQGGRGYVNFDKSNPFAEFRKWGTFRVDKEGENSYKDLVALIQQRDQQVGQVYSTQAQAYRTMNRAEGLTVRKIMGNNPTKPTKTTKEDIQYADDSIMAQEKLVSDLTQKWKTASGELRDGYLKDLEEAQQKLAEMTGKAKGDGAPTFMMSQLEGISFDNQIPTTRGNEGKAQDKLDLATAAFATSGTSNVDFSNYTAALQNAIKDANIGSELYAQLSEQLSDSSQVSQLLQQYVANGITGADLGQTAQELKDKLMNGEINDDVIQQYVDELNAKLMEKFDETEWPNVLITFDADTKNIVNAAQQQEKEAQKMAKNWQAAGSAIQAVGAAMNQIEDPAAKVLGTIAQAVATMALSYSQAAASPAVTGTGWGWIAFAATGVATMLSSIAAIKQATAGFANGGVIPGNSMSGDNLRGMTPDGTVYGLNSQEIILNRAQQGNLASQLEGGGIGNLHLDTVIGAEDIRLVLNNNGRRTGRGEYVQTNRR